MFVDVYDKMSLSSVSKPPSVIMKELFSAKNDEIEETMLEDVAKKVLSCNECTIWLRHLQTVLENRRRGARKAAATRHTKATRRTEIQETASSGRMQLSSHTQSTPQV